jgi:hypothetical protein
LLCHHVVKASERSRPEKIYGEFHLLVSCKTMGSLPDDWCVICDCRGDLWYD